MKYFKSLTAMSLLALVACAPEIGSKQWCENMDKKDKGDWTMTETKDYAKHCVFRSDD